MRGGYAMHVLPVALLMGAGAPRASLVDPQVDGAFFTPGQLRMFWLNWVDAAGRPIAGTTGLPGRGYMQFWPNGVPAIKTEVSSGWSY